MASLRWSCVAALALLAMGLSGPVNAQAPPGPLPGAPTQDGPSAAPPVKAAPAANVPRIKDLAGVWKLNLDESDDPQKKLQQASNSGGGGGPRRGGGGMGGGWPGSGGGVGFPGGGGGRGGYGGQGESDSDRQKMQIFAQPAQQLTIIQKEPEIDISDDFDRKLAAYTDGRKIEKSKDSSNQQMDARWDEYRLVMEGKDPRGNKYERSYEVLDGNRQLRETLYLKVGRSNTEVSIRYVYDLASKPRS